MITLTAKIDIISKGIEEIDGESINLGKNNISSELSSVVGKNMQSSSPFILGSSPLGGKYTYQSNVNYFIGNQLSNSDGSFTNPYIITFSNANGLPNQFFIKFDETQNAHPTTIKVNGVQYAVFEPLFLVDVQDGSTDIEITIDNWNKANSPLTITGIYVEYSFEINNLNLISLEGTISDRGDYKLPSYGIISNSGNLEFNDGYGKVLRYIENQILTSGMACTIYLNNTLEGIKQVVAVYESDNWDYDNDNRTVSVSLKDDLEKWQDINIDGIDYDPRATSTNTKPYSYYYKHFNKITIDNNFNMQGFDDLDSETKNILENTYLDYPLLENCTLWQAWTKLCEACQLHIYKDNRGIIVCKYNGGN